MNEPRPLLPRTPEECFYCERPAEAYCDYPDCDRPICAGHGRRVGHLCCRGKNKASSDTIDHCRMHDTEAP